MREPKKDEVELEPSNRDSQVPLMYFEPPWTEADEIFVECLTGEYDERLEREKHEREGREAGL